MKRASSSVMTSVMELCDDNDMEHFDAKGNGSL